MKTTRLAALALLSLALAARACAEQPNTLTDAERAAGWKLLFDGTTLRGWRSLASPMPGAGWQVIDGAITRTARSGDILTDGKFADFELSAEWKVADATNSGILYRVALGEPHTWVTGPEYQILDNVRASDRFDPKHRCGALYDLVAPAADFTRPVGEWNHARIIVRGWHIEHWMNGHKIVDADLASPEGKALIARSKFGAMPHFARHASGHIALQDEANAVSYRSIEIRELGQGR